MKVKLPEGYELLEGNGPVQGKDLKLEFWPEERQLFERESEVG